MYSTFALFYRPFWFGGWGATLLCAFGGVFAKTPLWLEIVFFLGLQALVSLACWRSLQKDPELATAAQMILGLSLNVLFATYSIDAWRSLGLEDLIYSVLAAPFVLGLVLVWGWIGIGLGVVVGFALGLLYFGNQGLFVLGLGALGIFGIFGWLMRRSYSHIKVRQEELEHLINTDALTQIGNRKALLEDFVTFQAAAQKNALPLLLTSWDVDGLKRVNDRQGHQAGDEYIKNFVHSLRQAVREGDGLYRTGGDEFVGLHLGLADGKQLYDRVRAHFPNVSGGWSRATRQTLDQALTEADVQMYAEKRARKAVITRVIGESQTR
ncbi:MAG: GGDEF domain-containing protein [Deinococcales bacterium]